MRLGKRTIRNGAPGAMMLFALAGGAMAQDPGLTMTLDRSVISAGESVNVGVAGRFPSTVFALAQVDFDVFASVDAWTWASSGVVAGDAVWGAGFDQTHMPSAGLFADPANPLHIWSGVYQPNVAGPAFLRLQAEADYFAYYPSDLTTSSVVIDALPGRQYLWVDPVHIAGVGRVAPGPGTDVEVRPGDLVVATPQEEAILIGLLLPAIQNAREATVRTDTLASPESLSVGVMLATGGADVAMEEITLNYEKVVDTNGTPLYQMSAAASFASEPDLCLIGPDGELICVPAAAASVRSDRLPNCLVFKIEQDDINGRDIVVASTCDDGPFHVEIPGVFTGMTTGPIEIRAGAFEILDFEIKGEYAGATGLPSGPAGAVSFRFSHVAACPADINNDGELNFFDVSAFVALFNAGDPAADFNGDGQANFFDFADFLSAFNAGCP